MLGGGAGARRRRFAGLLLVGGLVAAGLTLAESAPVEQTVTLRLAGDRAELRALDVAIFDARGDALDASQWNFAPRPPPPSLTVRLRAPRGTGTVRVTAGSAAGAWTREHRVSLDGSPVTIVVRPDADDRE
jgi:hypothetical protein